MVPANIRIVPIRDYIRRDEIVPPPFITPTQVVRPDERPFVRKFDGLPK